MSTAPYIVPAPVERPALAPRTAYLIASGDLRESANLAGWPTQAALEASVTAAFAELGWSVVRANPVDPETTGHGFISSQRMGLEGGYAGAVGWRQNPVYFPLGGSTIKGVSRPGEIVWSRVYIADGGLHVDLGRASSVSLPAEETERRWQATNPEWPIMHAVLHGVSRDQFMARHKANHLNVAYAPDAATADRALVAKAAFFDGLGVHVHLCGDVRVAPRVHSSPGFGR